MQRLFDRLSLVSRSAIATAVEERNAATQEIARGVGFACSTKR
jgi:hypothetical protein